MKPAVWMLLVCTVAARSAAAGAAGDEDDAAALALPGAPAAAATAHWATVNLEGAATDAAQRDARPLESQRLSVDARVDGGFAPGWRAVLAERLDSDWSESPRQNTQVGTLKEAYLGWQPAAASLLDLGRINARQGVAYGYNPTDFLRADAVRSRVSPDPNSLRENRLGTVMLRVQQLWASGAVSAAYAPHLTDRTSTAALDPDWAATNSRGRWLVTLSQQLTRGLTPQWLAYGTQGHAAQFGMNLTASVGSATVAYVEVTSGRSTTLLAQSLDLPAPESLHTRAATGFTYSPMGKLSVTLEYEYDGAGSNSREWSALRAGNPAVYGNYRLYALAQQDLPTKSNAFTYATWNDFIFRHLDLTAFVRFDLVDHSRLPYVELRRHWNSLDLALRWQDAGGGNATSDYGASSQRQTWQLLLDYYL